MFIDTFEYNVNVDCVQEISYFIGAFFVVKSDCFWLQKKYVMD